jgi:hypothetical protein
MTAPADIRLLRHCQCGIGDEWNDQVVLVGASIDAKREGSRAGLNVLGALQWGQDADHQGLAVAAPGVGPLDLGQTARLGYPAASGHVAASCDGVSTLPPSRGPPGTPSG